ncbi:ABC transporter permease [Roseateles koreensis]|uniref:ABC transporter permease subunit n=1 Tax=Roseateles koreensis TaxID=2987526 RepID=A0ABT5KVP1_9BURK|nr:ABC transporter permease subunit [Roseateles koreensis]MDC8786867.1 ABC transporter permease subunit [Roseateles koreensis]
MNTGRWISRLWLFGGYTFLYLPIFALLVYAFNDSPIPSVWGGLTLKWFAKLADDPEMLEGLRLSMLIAFLSASAAVVLGLLSAFALVKFQRFRGRGLLEGMVNAPLVMPEVIIGLSLLLMLVSLQRSLGVPARGAFTIWIGHVLLCMAYANVVVQARLKELPQQLEEAAMDLGAREHQVFFLVTLPMILPSLASAWLLCFTLSLDDVVLSEFLSGPGATTMPMIIFSRARLGLSPSVNAVAAVIIGAVSLGVIAASLWVARQERKRQRDMLLASG